MILLTGRMCLEAGAYLMNYIGCSQCGGSELVTRLVDNTDTESRDSWDTEDEEVELVEDIQYSHVCGACGHIIAIHKVSSDYHINIYHDDAVQVLAGGGKAGVQDGVSAVRHRRGQRLCDASRSQESLVTRGLT